MRSFLPKEVSTNILSDDAGAERIRYEPPTKIMGTSHRVIFPFLHIPKSSQNPEEILKRIPSDNSSDKTSSDTQYKDSRDLGMVEKSPLSVTSIDTNQYDLPILPLLTASGYENEVFANQRLSLRKREHPVLRQRVRFNPNVSVREFQRDESEFEMHGFNQHADELVYQSSPRISRKLNGRFNRLAVLPEEDDDDATKQHGLSAEVQRILVIDPNPLCTKLFRKSLRGMLPHAEVWTASSGAEALYLVERYGENMPFDVVLVEERLGGDGTTRREKNLSGSALIEVLKKRFDEQNQPTRRPLFIGVSAHFEEDEDKLRRSGATIAWPKPPPKFDKTMRDGMLQHLLLIRGKQLLPKATFHATAAEPNRTPNPQYYY
mmetsp:Transcript_19564/g.29732  ORF Transcript_19564/g.29732 Transcript_19564/m.29732 type:complete len:376 (+) Transcript_19564:117-1244(+)